MAKKTMKKANRATAAKGLIAGAAKKLRGKSETLPAKRSKVLRDNSKAKRKRQPPIQRALKTADKAFEAKLAKMTERQQIPPLTAAELKRIRQVEAERQKRMEAIPKTSPVREEIYSRCGSETSTIADECCRDFACYDRGRPTLSDLIESVQTTISDIQEEIDNWEESIAAIQEMIDEEGDSEL